MIRTESNIQQFINDYSFRLTPETVDLYPKAVRQLIEYCDKTFDEITPKDIRKWMIHLETNDYKPVTINSKLYGIKIFYQYCLEEKIISANPMTSITFPKIEDKLPYYLETEQLSQLRKIVEGCLEERAIIEVLYATGVRISELVAMKKEDIDWSERLIHIPKGKRKKARIVLFTSSCEEHLKAYVEGRQHDLPYVFLNTTATGPACIRTIQKKFDTYAKQLGIRITPHTLRHTFAAHLAKKEMSLACIQILLGHESVYQTQQYARLYNHARKEMYDE